MQPGELTPAQQKRMQALVYTSREHNISFAALALLMVMIRHADDEGIVIGTRKDMAEEMECSVEYIRLLLDQLATTGKIQRIPRQRTNGSISNNTYQLLF